jgi:hypothetical protein
MTDSVKSSIPRLSLVRGTRLPGFFKGDELAPTQS